MAFLLMQSLPGNGISMRGKKPHTICADYLDACLAGGVDDSFDDIRELLLESRNSCTISAYRRGHTHY
jgi:hypothetical protein